MTTPPYTATLRTASSASACFRLRPLQNQGPHHQHQPVYGFEERQVKAGSNSLFRLCSLLRITRTKLGRLHPETTAQQHHVPCIHLLPVRRSANKGRHHQHQHCYIFVHAYAKAGITSVNMLTSSNIPKLRPTSPASAGPRFRTMPNQSRLHEHAACLCLRTRQPVSLFTRPRRESPASSASACFHLRTPPDQSRHHQNQPVDIFDYLQTQASMISMILSMSPSNPEGNASLFTTACLRPQHHHHQPTCVFKHPPYSPQTKPGIISISVATRPHEGRHQASGCKPRPTSSASGGLLLRTPPSESRISRYSSSEAPNP